MCYPEYYLHWQFEQVSWPGSCFSEEKVYLPLLGALQDGKVKQKLMLNHHHSS